MTVKRIQQCFQIEPCFFSESLRRYAVSRDVPRGSLPARRRLRAVRRCRLNTHQVDPGLKALGFQPVESTSLSKVPVSDGSTCATTARRVTVRCRCGGRSEKLRCAEVQAAIQSAAAKDPAVQSEAAAWAEGAARGGGVKERPPPPVLECGAAECRGGGGQSKQSGGGGGQSKQPGGGGGGGGGRVSGPSAGVHDSGGGAKLGNTAAAPPPPPPSGGGGASRHIP